MAPVEWPIAARSQDRGPAAARRVDRERLSTVRADFFLDSDARLTEQERALMTGMLSDLVGAVADEIAAAVDRPLDNGDGAGPIFQRLAASGLLDLPQLIALLLRRAEEERITLSTRARAGSPGRFLHSLAADENSEVAAAAMGLILARSRRRDRFDCPRVALDDVPADAAPAFVYAVAAAQRPQAPSTGADSRLADAAAAVLSSYDEGKRMEAMTFALVHALDSAGKLDQDRIRSAAADGEIAFAVEALARRAGVDFDTAWQQFVAGGGEFARFLRMAGVSRQFAAELIAILGEVLRGGPGDAIAAFDACSDEEIDRSRAGWRLHPAYRYAAAVLGEDDGHAPD